MCIYRGLPRWSWWLRICLQCRRLRFEFWVRKIPWRRKWQTTPVFSPGEFHGQRRLVGYSPWGHKESDMTEHTAQPFTETESDKPNLGPLGGVVGSLLGKIPF